MSTHITEEEAVRVADGQPVPAGVAGHAESCEACAQRVADHALLSLGVQLDMAALAVAATEQETMAARRAGAAPASAGAQLPSSRTPLALGLLVALVASVPALPSVARDVAWLSGTRHFSAEALQQMVSALLSVASGPAWSMAATLGLLGLGVLIATHATRLERDSREAEGATK